DTAGVSIVQSGGSTQATEGGATDTYTVVLMTQPTSNVSVTMGTDAQVTATASLIFTPGNWATPQTVTVQAVNDLIAEGGHASTVTHTATSADGFYNGIAISNVTVTLTDNDTAGVSISPSGGTTNLTEGGASDTYDVVLTS